jgi:hypothetical protein
MGMLRRATNILVDNAILSCHIHQRPHLLVNNVCLHNLKPCTLLALLLWTMLVAGHHGWWITTTVVLLLVKLCLCEMKIIKLGTQCSVTCVVCVGIPCRFQPCPMSDGPAPSNLSCDIYLSVTHLFYIIVVKTFESRYNLVLIWLVKYLESKELANSSWDDAMAFWH